MFIARHRFAGSEKLRQGGDGLGVGKRRLSERQISGIGTGLGE